MIVNHRHYANGIDVSDNNGVFDWKAWDGAIDFAFIKASEGPQPAYPTGWHDTQFSRNWTESRALGLHRFAYHFFRPDHDPAYQARYFVDIITDAGLDLTDNFAIDFETDNPNMPVHEQAFAAWVFCTEVQRLTGHKHRILAYTDPAFADQGYCAMLGWFDLWIANWNVAQPEIPPPWSYARDPRPGWHFWQFAAGRNSGPDLDRFNGSPHELEVYCTR